MTQPLADALAAEMPPERLARHFSGYAGKDEYIAARDRLSAALAKLARHYDPAVRLAGVRLCAEAVDALDRLTEQAKQLNDGTDRHGDPAKGAA